MSVDAVNKFWERVSSDGEFQKALVHATRTRVVAFASEHNFKFTENDFKVVADKFMRQVETVRGELKAAHDKDHKAVAGKSAPDQFMANIQSDRLYERLGQIFDMLSISQSG